MHRSLSAPRPLPARLTTLDLLRFIAAMAVVFYHFIGSTTALAPWGPGVNADEVFPLASRFAHYGHFGVQLFFVISGFVILMSAWGRTVREFAASRVARLYPAYWASILLTGVVLVLLRGHPVTAIEVRKLLVNATMLQSGMGVPFVDTVYWTLWVELLFYVLIGIFLVTGMTYGRVVAFIAIWPVTGTLAVHAVPTLDLLIAPSFSAYFAGGMALYLLYAYGHSWLRWGLVGLNLALALAANAKFAVPGAVTTRGTLIIILIFAAVAVCTLTPARTWGGRVGTLLGRLTYPLYLTHNMWGLALIAFLCTRVDRWTTVALTVVAVLVLAWLINRLVEIPLAPRLRRAVLSGLDTPESIPREPLAGPPTPAGDERTVAP